MGYDTQVLQLELANRGSTLTNNEDLEKDGYLVIKNLWPPEELYYPVPTERGQILYHGSVDRFDYDPNDFQGVPGGLIRSRHPQYKNIFNKIRLEVQKVVGRNLYKTYYYDRFYFPGQDLKYHLDRDSCEISVTIHCSSNLRDKWPICIKSPDGSVGEVYLEPGDGLIYKGCERPHWRLPMSGVKRNKISKLLGMNEYY